MQENRLAEGEINEESLAEFRKRVGTKLRVVPFNEVATKDCIRQFMNGVGDVNPLYQDAEYAQNTRYGQIVAPVSWLYSVSPTWVLQGLPGVHAFHSGNDWDIFKPVLAGDHLRADSTFTGFEVKQSKFAGQFVMEYQLTKFYNQRNELVAQANGWLVRSERKAARETGKYSGIQLPHPWTQEELVRIEEEVFNEQIRGGEVRYWEDIQVGEELPALVKGPFGVTDMMAFTVGADPAHIKAFGAAMRDYRKHPAWGWRDPRTGAMEPVFAVHFDVETARSAGVPYPYDAGVQRNSFLVQLLTNWMGDEGWLKKCYAEYRLFFYLSDVLWLRGKVTEKFVDGEGEHCVRIVTEAVNQRGENTMPGWAIVALPSREHGTWPLDHRLGTRT